MREAILLSAVWRARDRRGAGSPGDGGAISTSPSPIGWPTRSAGATRTCSSRSSTGMRSTCLPRPRATPRCRATSSAPSRFSEAWQEARIAIDETETYNLDRKQHALNMIDTAATTRFECDGALGAGMALAVPMRYLPPIHYLHSERLHHVTRKILSDHADLLSERQAAYRPRLQRHRDRRARALPAARRQGRLLPDRHRRARPEDAADGARRRA